MEGQILGNRYELIEKIGGGGMAVVYKAKDRLLGRYVAVKILRPEFTNDEEFVKRFRIEAQAAASLSHPNIISIYDVGQEDNIHYIVMEYVDGITLKEYISKNSPLKWREAVNITIQICSAIEQAHKHFIIHRDIKPHNILLTSEGIAKIGDFGIARAVSSSTITMAGSTIGSVHYFSPEQARGGYIDEKSDLYSLGVAMYEMVTGQVPFDGETPVAVALKHIQEEAIPPAAINKSIPKGVNDIIMKAIRKEQSRRYQSASEMLSDLYRVLRDPDGYFVDEDDEMDSPTKRIQTLDDVDDIIQRKGTASMNGSNKKKGGKKDRYTVSLAIITSMIIMAFIGYIAYKVIFPLIIPQAEEFQIGYYVGKNINDVKAELEAKQVKVKEKRVFSDTVPKDIIMSQSIEPGQKIKQTGANTIEFEVSEGPELVTIPDLKLQDYRTAEADLKRLKLNPRVEEEFSDTVAIGYVIKTEPGANEKVRPGTEVIIYKSKGPKLEQVKIPNLVGLTRSEAQKALADAKLKIGAIKPEDSKETDKVIEQNPPADTVVDEGTAVDITTSPEDNNAPGKGGSNRKWLLETIELDKPERYGNIIKVLVEVTPSDTGKVETIVNERRSKDSFPMSVMIPVPEGGTTRVRIFLDNKFYREFYR